MALTVGTLNGGVQVEAVVYAFGLVLQPVGFLLELFTKLARHRARPAEPTPDGCGQLGQPFGPEHDQRNDEDNQYLGEIDSEH